MKEKYINPYTDFGFKKLFAEQQAKMKVTDKKSYQVIEVDPEIKKWSGCTSFSADEIESDPRLKAILNR